MDHDEAANQHFKIRTFVRLGNLGIDYYYYIYKPHSILYL